jgi:hypothetical protein
MAGGVTGGRSAKTELDRCAQGAPHIEPDTAGSWRCIALLPLTLQARLNSRAAQRMRRAATPGELGGLSRCLVVLLIGIRGSRADAGYLPCTNGWKVQAP